MAVSRSTSVPVAAASSRMRASASGPAGYAGPLGRRVVGPSGEDGYGRRRHGVRLDRGRGIAFACAPPTSPRRRARSGAPRTRASGPGPSHRRAPVAAARWSDSKRCAARFTLAVASYGPDASARAQRASGSDARAARCAITNVNGSAVSIASSDAAAPGIVAERPSGDGLPEAIRRAGRATRSPRRSPVPRRSDRLGRVPGSRRPRRPSRCRSARAEQPRPARVRRPRR